MAASSEASLNSNQSSDEDIDLMKQIIAVQEDTAEEFTQKQEIILLQELQKYRQKYGEKEVIWETFHEQSQLRENFSETELSEKCRRLEKSYRRNARERSTPAADHRDGRIFQLSHSLWGRRDPLENPEAFRRIAEFLSDDDDVPRVIMKHWGVMGKEDALHFEKRLTKIRDKELSLLNEKLIVKRQICELLLDLMPTRLFSAATQSPTSDPHRCPAGKGRKDQKKEGGETYDPHPQLLTANELATLQNGQELIKWDKKRKQLNGESAAKRSRSSGKENRRRKQPRV